MDTTPTEHLAQLIAKAQELADTITDQATRDQESFNAGYREAAWLFYLHGIDVGRTQAENDLADAWQYLAAKLAKAQPTHTELEQNRAEPGNLYRYTRGDNTEPDAHTAAIIRRQGTPYTGGPTPWTTEENTTQQPTTSWDDAPGTAA